ncbi:MAG: helix-turn-helix domain-containing protein [Candidatus Omnitrophota bacterium]
MKQSQGGQATGFRLKAYGLRLAAANTCPISYGGILRIEVILKVRPSIEFIASCVLRSARKKYQHFAEKERYKLEGYLEAKLKIEEIARMLNKHKATIYREINRGTVTRISSELVEYRAYRANVAQRDYRNKTRNRERSFFYLTSVAI